MKRLSAFRRRSYEAACTVEIENTADSLHAHVTLDGDVAIAPGDAVQVIDPPPRPPYGDRIVVRRRAIVTRAGLFERALTRLTGNFELNELYDVSFTERRFL